MDSSADSSGRVTRALRKRLTSIDSDHGSSRPGTPVQSKMAQVITNSPMKPRMTRRNSTSGVGTPVKTPGKRALNSATAIAEEVNATPSKRTTRRRTISQDENEATPTHDKKVPNLKSVIEEQDVGRITRSKSKSPDQAEIKVKAQRGRKPMVRNQTTSFSESMENTINVTETNLEDLDKSAPRPSLIVEEKDAEMDIYNNKENEIDVLNSSLQKRMPFSADAANAKHNQKGLSADAKSASSSYFKNTRKSIEGNKCEDKVIEETPQELKSESNRKENNEEENVFEGIRFSLGPSTSAKSATLNNLGESVEKEYLAGNVEEKSKKPDEGRSESPSVRIVKKGIEQSEEEKLEESKLICSPEATQADHFRNTPQKTHSLSQELNTATSDSHDDSPSVRIVKKGIEQSEEDKLEESKSNSSIEATRADNFRNTPQKIHSLRQELNTATADSHEDSPSVKIVKIGIEQSEEDKLEESKSVCSTEATQADHFRNTPQKIHSLSQELNTATADSHDEKKLQDQTSKLEEISEACVSSNSCSALKEDYEEKIDIDADISNNISNELNSKVNTNDFSKEKVTENTDKIKSILLESDKTATTNLSPVLKDSTPEIEVNDLNTPERYSRNNKLISNSDDDGSIKRVAFSSNNSEDERERSIYPKTPASIKTKRDFLHNQSVDESVQSECSLNESIVIIHDTTVVEMTEIPNEEIMSPLMKKKSFGEDKDTVNIIAEKMSTIIGENMSKKGECELVQSDNENDTEDKSFGEGKDTANINTEKMSTIIGENMSEKGECELVQSDNENDTEDKAEMELKWCHPKVLAKDCKLDTIGIVKDTAEKIAADESGNSKQRKKKTFPKQPEWNDENIIESSEEEHDEEYFENGEEEEDVEHYKRKHPFHDDEAMVVDDDYESGDSMDSEERREIIENEIRDEGESIGSQTTEEDDNEDDEIDNDSFIASEDCDEEQSADSSCSEILTKVRSTEDRNKKRKYKRIQRISEVSSSDEDVQSEKDCSKTNDNNADQKLNLNETEISNKSFDSTLRLQYHAEDETDSSSEKEGNDLSKNNEPEANSIDETAAPKKNANKPHKSDQVEYCEDVSEEEHLMNTSRKSILQKLNASEVFNKSIRDLGKTGEVSPDDVCNNGQSNDIRAEKSDSDEDQQSIKNVNTDSQERVASDDENDQKEDSPDSGSDAEKNNKESKKVDISKKTRGLSTSFGNIKQQKQDNDFQKENLRRSFTIGVTVYDGELQTEINQTDLTTCMPIASSSTSSPSMSSNENTDAEDDAHFLKNIKQMPLGNPLVRTRRQSLALPTNPDMEIGLVHQGSSKPHRRRTLAVLSGNEFNPSQSFVDSLELQKTELERQTFKRKRLSKSFSGMPADNSVVDIDACHLHKRSKLSLVDSFAESFDNTKPNNSACLKVNRSSTPHAKGSIAKLSNSATKRIMTRCDEILEAANRAKLEEKLNHRKSKIRLAKKNKKKLEKKISSPESKNQKAFAPIAREIKKKDKTKLAVTQALKASANIIIGQKRKQDSLAQTSTLPPVVVKSISKNKSEIKKDNQDQFMDKIFMCRNYSTAAGNVVESIMSPPEEKKTKTIRLPTGTICIEPLTPTKRSVLTCNGMEFYECPMTPSSVGFKVRELNSSNGKNYCSKRKRNEDGKKRVIQKPQWTQSGPFLEEELLTSHDSHSVCKGRSSKRENRQTNSYNFKQNALNRDDIKRSTAREVLQLRERRQIHNHY